MIAVQIGMYADCSESVQFIRKRVFIEEQGVPEALEIDGLDERCVHVLICDGESNVATGRMMPDGHIGRVAVMKAYRGRGMGRLVMDSLMQYASKHDYGRVWLSSQCRAVGFYEALGFVAYGGVFNEAGIEHIKMEKIL